MSSPENPLRELLPISKTRTMAFYPLNSNAAGWLESEFLPRAIQVDIDEGIGRRRQGRRRPTTYY